MSLVSQTPSWLSKLHSRSLLSKDCTVLTSCYRLSRSKKSLTIYHKTAQSATPSIVFDGYPKDVGVTSGTIRGAFLTVNKMTLTQMREYHEPTAVTITGGAMASVKQALKWALSSCDGKGLKSYAPGVDAPIVQARDDEIAGRLLDMPSFVTRVDTYIRARLSKGLLSEKEVHKLHYNGNYLEYRLAGGIPAQELAFLLKVVTAEHATFDIITQHVADHTTHDMQAKYNAKHNPTATNSTENHVITTKNHVRYPSDAYISVRKAFPDPFGKAVDAKICAWQKMIAAQRQPPPPVLVHKEVSLPQVRKTGKYKFKLDLADVGVTGRSFIGGGHSKKI